MRGPVRKSRRSTNVYLSTIANARAGVLRYRALNYNGRSRNCDSVAASNAFSVGIYSLISARDVALTTAQSTA